MELYVVKKFGTLRPYAAEDADEFSTMQEDQPYKIKVSRPRNVKFHRKYFVLLKLVLDNLPEGFALVTPVGNRIPVNSVKSLLWHIKMQNGYYTEKMTLGGRITYEADSISFGSMDEPAFQKFYSESIDTILKYFLVGADRSELEEAVIMEFG